MPGFHALRIRLKILINYLTPLTKYDSITYERKKDCTKCSIVERYHRDT